MTSSCGCVIRVGHMDLVADAGVCYAVHRLVDQKR